MMSTDDAAIRYAHGRAMMRAAKAAQKPREARSRRAAPGRRTLPRSTLRPTRWSSAGSNVAAATTATATTSIAAPAIDCTARTGTIQTVPSETITVSPEKTTAVPDVRIACAVASALSRPAASSSRKRARMNSE